MSIDNSGRANPTYTFQVTMDDSIVMQIAETTSDPDQLRTSERRIRLSMN